MSGGWHEDFKIETRTWPEVCANVDPPSQGAGSVATVCAASCSCTFPQLLRTEDWRRAPHSWLAVHYVNTSSCMGVVAGASRKNKTGTRKYCFNNMCLSLKAAKKTLLSRLYTFEARVYKSRNQSQQQLFSSVTMGLQRVSLNDTAFIWARIVRVGWPCISLMNCRCANELLSFSQTFVFTVALGWFGLRRFRKGCPSASQGRCLMTHRMMRCEQRDNHVSGV